MDLSDLLLVLVFVILPLLQQLLERATKSPPPPPPAEEEEAYLDLPPLEGERRPDLFPTPETGGHRPVPLPLPEAGGRRPDLLPFPERAGEREGWRAEAAEEIARREVVDEEAAAELTVLQSRLPAETVPEAVRVSAPVVSLETLRVERPAKPVRPAMRAEAEPAPARLRLPPRAGELLRGPGSLRRAILLSEVLGPPKGLE